MVASTPIEESNRAFAEIVLADPELLDLEFESIVSQLRAPRRTATAPPPGPASGSVCAPRSAERPAEQRTDSESRSRARSPPLGGIRPHAFAVQ